MQRALNSVTAYLHDALAAVRTPRGGMRNGPFQPDTPPTLPEAGVSVTVLAGADKTAPEKRTSTTVVGGPASERELSNAAMERSGINGQAGDPASVAGTSNLRVASATDNTADRVAVLDRPGRPNPLHTA